MTDNELMEECAALEPTPDAQARMEGRVMDWLEAERTPLRDEWLAMVRTAPVQGLSFAFAGAAALFLTTPMLAVLQLLN